MSFTKELNEEEYAELCSFMSENYEFNWSTYERLKEIHSFDYWNNRTSYIKGLRIMIIWSLLFAISVFTISLMFHLNVAYKETHSEPTQVYGVTAFVFFLVLIVSFCTIGFEMSYFRESYTQHKHSKQALNNLTLT